MAKVDWTFLYIKKTFGEIKFATEEERVQQ